MPSKKRKPTTSRGGEQAVISKFFKASPSDSGTSNRIRRQKKVAVIQILDDDSNEASSSLASPSSKSSSPENVLVKSEDNNNGPCQPESKTPNISESSMKKLANFSIGNKVDTNRGVILSPHISKKVEDTRLDLSSFSHSKHVQETSVQENGKKKKETGTKVNYTPLEKQVIELRKISHGALLIVECGYKYRFFGQDADIAAKELNICCHVDHNFMTASIPVHRLKVHLSRLVEKGYKVGIVNQMETAALKAASDNKNTPFTRELTNIYTKATYIDREDKNLDDDSDGGNYIISMNQSKNKDGDAIITIIAVNPTTNDVIYDQYPMTSSDIAVTLETLFSILKPSEFVLPSGKMHQKIEQIVSSYVRNVKQQMLVERLGAGLLPITPPEGLPTGDCEKESIFSCISLLGTYLKQFNLDRILESVNNFRKFSLPKQSMVLDGITLRNLEIFENNTDGGKRGSLFRLVDHTCTPFGRRLLKRWIANPLVCPQSIDDRLDALTEISGNWESDMIKSMRRGLAGCPDLENGLTIILLKKASPAKFLKTIGEVENARSLFSKYTEESSRKFSSTLLVQIYREIPLLLGTNLQEVLIQLDLEEAKKNNKENLFNAREDFYPNVFTAKQEIKAIEQNLDEYRKTYLPKVMGKFSVEYKCVSGLEYLVEVKNSELKTMPSNWIKISATKQCTRFRPPRVDELFKKLCRKREQLSIAANEAWSDFLEQFIYVYDICRKVVEKIATFDCLMSLAIVAKQPGYCRPSFDGTHSIDIKDGRHPVIEGLLTVDKQYVANDTRMSAEKRVMLISGPNMGGKSSYIKQVAINCILAQIGSYVAASHAKLCILDGVYTRMGASDNIARGKSTFMVELEEASRILRQASDNSLVVLDELGRGTSTFDGMAIASATLQYFIEDVKPFTLFVSHYPILQDFQKYSTCANYHMGFITAAEQHADTNEMERWHQAIVFLYQLTEGVASKSYGLNVARLAGVNQPILNTAALKAAEMEENVKALRMFRRLLGFATSPNCSSLLHKLLEQVD